MKEDFFLILAIFLFCLGMILGQAMEEGRVKATESRYQKCVQTRDEYHEIIKQLLPTQ